jgi:hypothetical protein
MVGSKVTATDGIPAMCCVVSTTKVSRGFVDIHGAAVVMAFRKHRAPGSYCGRPGENREAMARHELRHMCRQQPALSSDVGNRGHLPKEASGERADGEEPPRDSPFARAQRALQRHVEAPARGAASAR